MQSIPHKTSEQGEQRRKKYFTSRIYHAKKSRNQANKNNIEGEEREKKKERSIQNSIILTVLADPPS